LTWLPDGRIVFSLNELAPHQFDGNIWTINVDPHTGRTRGKLERVTNWTGFEISGFSSSADGRRVSFSKLHSQDVVKISEIIPGTDKMTPPRRVSLESWNDSAAGWTPDRHSILFVSSRNGRKTIYKQALSGSALETLVSGPESYFWPQYSPTGSWLLYTATSDDALEDKSTRLVRMPTEGGPPSVVLPHIRYGNPDKPYDCSAPPTGLCVVSEIEDKQIVFYSLDPLNGRGAKLASIEDE
jgi:hypothetical protein